MDKVRFSQLFIVILFLTLTPTFASEGPLVDVTIEDVRIIDTVTADDCDVPGFRPHICFPGIYKNYDGTLKVCYHVGQTTSNAYCTDRYSNARSYDNGQTWSVIPYERLCRFELIRPPGQTSYGFYIDHYENGFTTWTNSRYTSTNGGDTWNPTSPNANFNSNGVVYVSMCKIKALLLRLATHG